MGVARTAALGNESDAREMLGWMSGILNSVSAVLITTVDSTGIMHTHQLPNTNTGYDRDLRFLSTLDMPVVEEVKAHPNVLVTFTVRGAGRYLVVKGSARVRRDPAMVRELWHPALSTWFPGGQNDPALAVLHVDVKHVDVWE